MKKLKWDDLFGVIFVIILICIVFAFFGGIYQWMKWLNNAPQYESECTLVSKSYRGSTLDTHAITSVNMNGEVSVGTITSGEAEEYTTIWECTEGTLISHEEEIFHKSKSKHMLLLKDYRVSGLQIKQLIR